MSINKITATVTWRRFWLFKIAAYAQFFANTFYDWAVRHCVKVGTP